MRSRERSGSFVRWASASGGRSTVRTAAPRVATLAVALAMALASCAKSAVINGPLCTAAETDCDGVCADVKNDSENCGKCGFECAAGQACVSGACTTQCPAQNKLCTTGDAGAGRCVNVKTDNQNCGACGKTCKTGEVCFAGACASTCGSGASAQTVCGSDAGAPYCANLKTDNANCGACGKACAAGEACNGGTCTAGCTSDQTACPTDAGPPLCANLQSDNTNCGACGAACGVLEACMGGACVPQCAPGQLTCTPDGGVPYCTDGLSDNANCGACGKACPSNKPVCSGGSCSDGTCNRTALFLGDTNVSSNAAFVTLLQNAGFTVTSSSTTGYSGTPAATAFGVVVITPGTTYSSDMPAGGQKSIASAQAAGTGVIMTEWVGYLNTNNQYLTLKPLVLFPRSSGNTSVLTFTNTTPHPIWNGLPSTFTTSQSLGTNVGSVLNSGATLIATCTQCSNVGVAVKDAAGGRIVQVAHAAGYSGSWNSEPNLVKMMSNAALWAARCN